MPPRLHDAWHCGLSAVHPAFACSVFLVFDYIGGGDLARVLDSMDVPFRTSHAKSLMRQLLKACAFLHDRWIVHRDLKLSNLLLTDECASCAHSSAILFGFESACTPHR